MEYGNIKLSKIVQMKIDYLGNAFFYDSDFIPSKDNPEWANFKQKIKTEKRINLETTILVQERIKKATWKIETLIYGTEDEKELKNLFESFTDEQCTVLFADKLFTNIVLGFFEQLKQNIANFLPCDIPQDKIAQYTLAKHINKFVNYPNPLLKGGLCTLYSNKERAEAIEKCLCYFFKKNSMGLYEPSLDKTNEQIKIAFKSAGKKLDDLKALVDTDKGRSLKNVSTSWKTVKKLLDEECIFDRIAPNAVIQYKLSYFIYMLLKNFEKTIDSLIPQLVRSKMIEDILNNMEYLKSLRDYHSDEENPAKHKIPETAMEHILYDDRQPLRAAINNGGASTYGYFGTDGLNINYFWYDRKSPDDMKPLLEYGAQEKYIDLIFKQRSSDFTRKQTYGEDTFNRETELYFQEKICCAERIGKSSPFFFKWYGARIEYAEYHRGRSTIEKVSQAYLEAYDAGLYFAGKYTTKFVEEAIKVFLEEYKLTKRTGRIKEIYQYATALCLTMQLYKDFKKADFSDPAINPYEWYIKMWDSGYDVVDIAEFTGLSWQTIRNILTENKKFLKRNDEESLNELGRYITKWDCDEYGILTDEDWD